MFSRDISLVFLLCPSVFSLTFILTAVFHLFKLGKSKTRIKKEAKCFSLIEKLSLKGYVSGCKHYYNIAKNIRRFYLLYLIIVVAGLLIILLSPLIASLNWIADYLGFIKFIIFDIPFLFFCFFQTKHDKKNGGITWKWKVPER